MESLWSSLWKATRRILKQRSIKSALKRKDDSWASTDGDRTEVLAQNFSSFFKLHTDLNNNGYDLVINDFLSSPFQLALPLKFCSLVKLSILLNNFHLKNHKIKILLHPKFLSTSLNEV